MDYDRKVMMRYTMDPEFHWLHQMGLNAMRWFATLLPDSIRGMTK